MFPEALMLHYLDDLDSKMESMRAHFEREADLENAWTSYNPSLGRPLLNTAKFLEKKKPAVASAPTQAPSEELVSDSRTPTLPGLEMPENNSNAAPVAAAARPDEVS
jgi:3'-5' exoribonuclease